MTSSTFFQSSVLTIYSLIVLEKWSLDELAKVTGMSSSYISSRIGFWVSKVCCKKINSNPLKSYSYNTNWFLTKTLLPGNDNSHRPRKLCTCRRHSGLLQSDWSYPKQIFGRRGHRLSHGFHQFPTCHRTSSILVLY